MLLNMAPEDHYVKTSLNYIQHFTSLSVQAEKQKQSDKNAQRAIGSNKAMQQSKQQKVAEPKKAERNSRVNNLI